MKIAVVSVTPIGLDSGSNKRNYYLVNGLKKTTEVNTYIPSYRKFKSENHQLPFLNRVKITLQGKIPYIEVLKKEQLSRSALQNLAKVDVIQLQEMTAYYFFEKYKKSLNVKYVLDTHNIDYIRFLSETDNKNLLEKYVGRILAMKLKKDEISALKKLHHVIVCSDIEKEYYKKFIPSNRITVIPNGVDCDSYSVANGSNSKTVLFMGLLLYPPNSSGIAHYIKHIHPNIKERIPKVKLVILGKGCPDWLKELVKEDDSIEIKGFVEDVRKYIADASVCICPVYSGSGTRLKILEYMAMGKAVVSATKGAEGIETEDGKDILLSANDNIFAQNVINSLENKKLNKALGENARKLVEKKYDWKIMQRQIQELYKKL